MTREEAIALRPQSARSYAWQLGMGLLFAIVFFVALVCSHTLRSAGVGLLFAGLGFVLILLISAAQAWERLFRPIQAAARTEALSERARNLARHIGTASTLIGLGMVCLSSVAIAMSSSVHHPVLSDLRVEGWFIYFLRFLLADLRGEKPHYTLRERMNIAAGQAIDWRQWNPIRSEHWGER